MTVPARINLVTLGVSDVERSSAFYRALGWPMSSGSDPTEVCFFALDNCVLAVFGHDALAADANIEASTAPSYRGVTTAINVGSPAEVDATLEAAVAAGAKLVKSGEHVFWGGYSGYFSDPDGHLWEVAHNPHWPLDDRGNVQLPMS